MPDGRPIAGETIDMSSGGTSIRFSEAVELAPQTEVRLAFPMPAVGIELPATVVSSEGSVLRVRFEDLSIAEEEVLTMVLYSRADSWLGWGESRESDNVLHSLGRIFQISMHGLVSTFRSLFTDKDKETRQVRLAFDCPHLGDLAAGRASDWVARQSLHGQASSGAQRAAKPARWPTQHKRRPRRERSQSLPATTTTPSR